MHDAQFQDHPPAARGLREVVRADNRRVCTTDVLAADDAGIPAARLSDRVGKREGLLHGEGHDHGRFELRHGTESRSD